MPTAVIQIPSIILPIVWTLGTETETINDIVEHTSLEVWVDALQEKEVHITAIETIVAGIPGNLLCWIELSPYPTANTAAGGFWPAPLPISAAFWAAIGGGGGAIAPAAPLVEVATGVNTTVHSIILPWAIHSSWARLVMQTPISATPLTSFWIVQAQISAKH